MTLINLFQPLTEEKYQSKARHIPIFKFKKTPQKSNLQ